MPTKSKHDNIKVHCWSSWQWEKRDSWRSREAAALILHECVYPLNRMICETCITDVYKVFRCDDSPLVCLCVCVWGGGVICVCTCACVYEASVHGRKTYLKQRYVSSCNKIPLFFSVLSMPPTLHAAFLWPLSIHSEPLSWSWNVQQGQIIFPGFMGCWRQIPILIIIQL